MKKMSKIYCFNNASGEFIYSGHTGLLVENNDRIKAFLYDKTEDQELEEYIFGRDTERVERSDENYLTAITVFCTNYCNLSCSYCYHKENNLEFSENMDIGLFQETMEYMFQNMKHGKIVNVLFFGGEPLLNFDFIRSAVGLLKGMEEEYSTRFMFSITTNGTVITDEMVDFLRENQIRLMISIDGKKEVHDTMRKFVNGKGSYDVVVNNIKKMSSFMKVPARVTLTDLDTDLIFLYEDLIEKGFNHVKLAVVSSKDNAFDLEIAKENLSKRLKEMAEYMAIKLSNKEWVHFVNYTDILKKIHNASKSLQPCPSMRGSYTVSSKGEFYLCHRFNNVPEYTFGDIKSGMEKERAKAFVMSHSIDNRNSSCSSCWAATLCGGLCYHASYTDNGNTKELNALECHFNKELIRNALHIYSSLGEDIIASIDNRGKS